MTNFCGRIKEGKNINDIKIIPEKKIQENNRFLNINKFYINSDIFCLLLITWIFDPLINISIGFALKL